MLDKVPLGNVTVIVPLVAFAGTAVSMAEPVAVKVAGIPLKLTAVAPVKFVPRIVTFPPTGPETRCGVTKGPRPVERLKIVPEQLVE